MASHRALPLLALSACLPTAELAFPLRDDAQSFALVVLEPDRTSVIGLEPTTQIPLSIDPDAELFLLAFAGGLPQVGLEVGPNDVAGEGGRPIPEPAAWSPGSPGDPFGDWSMDPVPARVAAVRIADLDLPECWRSGGCAAIDPIRCIAPCMRSTIMPPAAVELDPLAPELPMAPAPPSWVPSSLGGCAMGEAQFFGASTCSSIGPPCPPDGGFSVVDAGAIYVDIEAAIDGSGSMESPRNRIPPLLAPGAMLVLAEGTYDLGSHPQLAGVAIYGACVGDTHLIDVDLAAGSELHGVRLLNGAELSGDVSLFGVESLGRIGVRDRMQAYDLSVRGSVGVEAQASLTIHRFYAQDVRKTAINVTGSLTLTDAVVLGMTASEPVFGAITINGPADIAGLYIEDVERFALLAANLPDSGEHSIRDVIVRRVRFLALDRANLLADIHRGAIWFIGEGRLERTLIDDTYERGITYQTAGNSTIADATISRVHLSETSSGEGIATVTSTGARIERALFRECYGASVLAGRSELRVEDLDTVAGSSRAVGLYAVEKSSVRLKRAAMRSHGTASVLMRDSDVELESVTIADLDRAVTGLWVATTTSAGGRAAKLRASRLAIRGSGERAMYFRTQAHRIDAELSDMVVEGLDTALDAQGGNMKLELKHTDFRGVRFGMGLRGAEVVLSDVRFDDLAVGAVINDEEGGLPMPTTLIAERLEVTGRPLVVFELDQPEASLTLRDVSIEDGTYIISCSGLAFDRARMDVRLERFSLDHQSDEVDAVALDLTSCDFSGADVRIENVEGVGAAVVEVGAAERQPKFELERFIFSGNQTAIRAAFPILLKDGEFVGNSVALDLGGVQPRPDQLEGVSFEGNALDLY